jgi:hypothetical protein
VRIDEIFISSSRSKDETSGSSSACSISVIGKPLSIKLRLISRRERHWRCYKDWSWPRA